MPQKGCAAPQVSWLTAMAKLMVATPSPVAEFSGDRNSPNTERDPIVTARRITAAAVTARTAEGLRACMRTPIRFAAC